MAHVKKTFLGNQEVSLALVVGEPRYGMDINSLIGEVDSNGLLQRPITPATVSFDGIKEVLPGQFGYMFYDNQTIRTLIFPDWTGEDHIEDYEDLTICDSVMQEACRKSKITTFSAPKLKVIHCWSNAFKDSDLQTLNLPELEEITGEPGSETAYCRTFSNTKITTLNLPSLKTLVAFDVFSDNLLLTTVNLPVLEGSIPSYSFDGCSNLTTVNAPLVTEIGTCAFRNCGLTSLDFPSVTTIGSNAFQGCPIQAIHFDGITTISSTMTFNNMSTLIELSMDGLENAYGTTSYTNIGAHTCPYLESASFKKLETASKNLLYSTGGFKNDTSLVSVDFSSLREVNGQYSLQQGFSGCTALRVLRFPAMETWVKGTFADPQNNNYGMCKNCVDITIHFPIDTYSRITNSTTTNGYSFLFGATSGSIVFDIVRRIDAEDGNGNSLVLYRLERAGMKDPNNVGEFYSMAWDAYNAGNYPMANWVADFYTTGTEPQVGDTLYTDEDCTEATDWYVTNIY